LGVIHLLIMLRQMDKQRQQTRASLNWSNARLMRVLRNGIWSLMKHYGHTRWHAMEQPKYHHIN
jgi:hypothetical protein